MKVAFIGQKGIPMIFGGVEKHVEEVSTRLAARGHAVIVYTRPNYTNKQLKKYKGVQLISRPVFLTKHLEAISHTFFSVIDVIFRKKIDIIHFHSIGPSFLIFLVKLFKPLTPVVATFHSQCYAHEKWSKFARFSLRLGEFVCCTSSDEVITVSKELKQYAENKYRRRVEYIPNGVPLYEQKQANIIRKHWGLKKGEYILSVSRIIQVKGLHYLIDAYKQVNTYKKLVIVGDGAYSDDYVNKLKEMAAEHPNIIFTGRRQGAVLKELYSNAYLFAQTSDTEGMPIALLEALSYSLPVLMSDISGNRAAAGDVGFVFKKGNVEDLQKILQYALNHPVVAANKGKHGRKRAERYFEWDKIIDQIEEKYWQAQMTSMEKRGHLPRVIYLKKVIAQLFL
ncbi:MAG: glycosyltransferase family 4 protein [Patescibacteria group bacterium]|nr:glycosyltransferase family 4 protein [Patescibacteria group bacterium]